MAYYKETVKIYGGSDLKNKVQLFNKKGDEDQEKKVKDPFSQQWKNTIGVFPKKTATTLEQQQPQRTSSTSTSSQGTLRDKLGDDYGRPVQGSKTEYRGMKAGQHINNEILTLCEMINEFGVHEDEEDGEVVWIFFKEIFDIYTRISNKVVGMLLRGRKYGLIHFEGEMLFQKRDDQAVITLLKCIEDIRVDAGLPDPRQFKNPFAKDTTTAASTSSSS